MCPFSTTITCCFKALWTLLTCFRGKHLQNVVAQNLGLACSLSKPAVVGVPKPSWCFSAGQDLAWRMQEALQNMSEPSIFLDATLLPRAEEREGIPVDFRAATLPMSCGQTPGPWFPGGQWPNSRLEWSLMQSASTQSSACPHPPRLVETCQAASPKALHLF